jgi:RNA polymerase sigma-70 factor (ECF subfamily)
VDPSELSLVQTRLRRLLGRTARDPDLADDLCQSVLLKTWAYYLRHGALPSLAYIRRSGLNAFYSWRRRKRPCQLAEGFDRARDDGDPAGAVETMDRARIHAAVDSLPPLYRSTARLRLLEDWPEQQIAEHLGLNINTVKTRISRAKAILKQRLRTHWSA